MKLLLLSLILSQSADAATTCSALRSGRFAEGNPLMPGATCGRVVALKAATVLPLAFVIPHVRNKKLAITLSLIPTGAAGAAVTINLRRMK
jgi:hypothetical protein